VPAVPEWGSMLEPPLNLILAARWWKFTPLAALFVALLAFNLLGEGLRRRRARGELQRYT
jgi:ABC-type dipeptide/oligopeptide/nickel transport system permease subunit